MTRTFADLMRLADSDPKAYAIEIERMQLQDPERFERFVEHLRKRLAKISPNVVRRHSSIHALLVGDIKKLEAKHRSR